MMRTWLAAAAFAVMLVPAHAGEDSTHRWFGYGLPWYAHPCGLEAFKQYGEDERYLAPYHVTKRDPSLCARLFPK